MKFLLSTVLVFFCCAAQALPPTAAEKLIFDQLNQERQKAQMPALEWNELAAEAARRHARMLARNEELSHQYPGEPSLPERLGATGLRFTNAAENIARTDDIQDIHPALMHSPGHRANILSSKYNAVGIGVAEDKGRIFVAQDFIFFVPVYSEEQFGAAFAEAVTQARRSRGFRGIEAHSDPYLRGLACSTSGDASSLAGSVSGKYVVVFTSSDPHRLPQQMQNAAAAPNYYRMSFGVCFRPEKEHGYGNFWVVAVFGG